MLANAFANWKVDGLELNLARESPVTNFLDEGAVKLGEAEAVAEGLVADDGGYVSLEGGEGFAFFDNGTRNFSDLWKIDS